MPTPSLMQLLGLSGFKGPEKGTEMVMEYAKEAAANFLNNNVPLNDTIKKIAQTEGLSPDDVEMTCWEANKRVHTTKFASATDKYIEFPLADANSILGGLQSNTAISSESAGLTGTMKTASIVGNHFDSDYQVTPEAARAVNDYEICKSAGHDGKNWPLKNRAHRMHEKVAINLREIESQIAMAALSTKQAEITFMKEARAGLLELPFRDRPQGLEMIAKMANAVHMTPKYRKDVLSKLATVLVKQGLIENTACLDSLISDSVAATCQVVNGNHQLYKLISTLKDENTRREALEDTWNVVRTKQTELESKLRLL